MRPARSTLVAVVSLAMLGSPAVAQSDSARRDIVAPGRSTVTTTFGIVAAIAANAALALMEPAMNGVRGDLFAIIDEAKTGTVYGPRR